MPAPIPTDPHEAVRRWRGIWLWPLLLSLSFSVGVGIWLHRSQKQEIDDEYRNLIIDALSLQTRIEDRLSGEQVTLEQLAQRLPSRNLTTQLPLDRELITHLGQLWISVTALDERNRLLVHLEANGNPNNHTAPNSDQLARSLHLVASLPNGGRLIARLDPAALLRITVPWWLARRYDVRWLDGEDQRIASLTETHNRLSGQSHRIALDTTGLAETHLELSTREPQAPWWRTTPIGLMLVFVLLSGLASLSLRQQMHQVATAEQRWRREAAWRRAIEESLTVGLRARDLEGRVVHVNRAFADLVGYPAEDLVGQMPPMPYWLPDKLEDSMRRHRRNLAGQAPREGYETQFRRSDGGLIDVMMFEAPWLNDQGEQLGWMGSFIDISASKAAQIRERRHLDTLVRQARLTMLGEVASALAHQLNQPLAAVASYQAGIKRMLERQGQTPASVLDALTLSNEQVEAAGQVVQRIRGFLTRHAPQRENTDLTAVINRALHLLRHDLQQRGIKIEWQMPAHPNTVWADPVLLEQVLINLVRNAADALQGHAQPTIHLEIQATAQGCTVSVSDNGPGLQGQDIDALANPFYTTKPDGMGMGLSICRSIIEAHHGALNAQDLAQGGACLSFTLPCTDTPAQPQHPSMPP